MAFNIAFIMDFKERLKIARAIKLIFGNFNIIGNIIMKIIKKTIKSLMDGMLFKINIEVKINSY